MTTSFYDVKTRQKVTLDVSDRKEYKSKSGVRYAVRAKTADGRWLTKFVNKMDYDKSL